MKWYVKYTENGKQMKVEVRTLEEATAMIENDLSKREGVDNIKIESNWVSGDDWMI